jgi:acyl CoA:acetate/3-ketoacid CoA transferase beta subunit
MNRFSREQLASRVAKDIPEGAYVNLGIGLPTTVANYLPVDKDIILQSEKTRKTTTSSMPVKFRLRYCAAGAIFTKRIPSP